MAKGDNRAVIGASGKPQEGMVLSSGAAQIAKIIGRSDAPSKPKETGCMRFKEPSIGAPPDGS